MLAAALRIRRIIVPAFAPLTILPERICVSRSHSAMWNRRELSGSSSRGIPVIDPKTGATAFNIEAAMRFVGEVKTAPPASGKPLPWRQR